MRRGREASLGGVRLRHGILFGFPRDCEVMGIVLSGPANQNDSQEFRRFGSAGYLGHDVASDAGAGPVWGLILSMSAVSAA
jgi:hypothetical protein